MISRFSCSSKRTYFSYPYRSGWPIIWLFILIVFSLPAHAQGRTPDNTPDLSREAEAFPACIANLEQQAISEGIPASFAQRTLEKRTFLPRIIELDRKQPEFTVTFSEYMNRRVTPERVARGRELLRDYRDLLDQLAIRYGIPPQYLVAFWGLETNYGSYLGKVPTLDALATLACDQRRSEYFTTELINVLRLLQKPGIDEPLYGSWAGAMGHTQFMPSAYLRYAVDGDGDGVVNLWTSEVDALTSAANFLGKLGWKRGFRWGREVRLPAGFDFAMIGRKNKQSLEQWSKLGIRTAQNQPLPKLSPGMKLNAALLVPAGYEGPAFLVYDNFEIIMRWNFSEFYALSVGHLADRINGAGKLVQPPPDNLPRLSREVIKQLQLRLQEEGYSTGTPDGILGPRTKEAIRNFQSEKGMVADGYPRSALFLALDMNGKEAR